VGNREVGNREVRNRDVGNSEVGRERGKEKKMDGTKVADSSVRCSDELLRCNKGKKGSVHKKGN